ncbi:glycerol-3-phosphate acyltransferase PlsX [Hamadaea flava]|uniref:Phosphate acyltransferase n=1 Tax=Hamadaea flava TaxID=1742688 RepID=A0ABV8LM73_9ACTN|nr:phosphate acyltransferase PlsX [Hamadaea flava]MCP2324970.1 glycerol-3-phosphate acyltransferase PlsX [Hamadaea flava]
MTLKVTRKDDLRAGRSVDNGPAGDASSGPVKIAVDLLGGDDAPAVVVGGALQALAVDPGLRLILVGPPDAADAVIRALSPADRERVELHAVSGAVTMADPPVRAASRETSIRAAAHAVAVGAADAMVSAGSSGATVTAAVLALGRSSGVRKPPLAAWLPTVRPGQETLLLDVGGSMDCTVAVLQSHAGLGTAYWSQHTGQAHPRIGLLSVGREPGKGDRVRRAAEKAFAATDGFVGLVEGDDVLLGDRADVVVTDGFTGNVLLKGIEGAYRLATVGVDGASHGMARAAVMLGVPGVVVVCHGAADEGDLASGLAEAARLARSRRTGRAEHTRAGQRIRAERDVRAEQEQEGNR